MSYAIALLLKSKEELHNSRNLVDNSFVDSCTDVNDHALIEQWEEVIFSIIDFLKGPHNLMLYFDLKKSTSLFS